MARASYGRHYILSPLVVDALALVLAGPGEDDVVRFHVEVFLARHTSEDDLPTLDCVKIADDNGTTVLELRDDDATRFVLSDRWPDGIA